MFGEPDHYPERNYNDRYVTIVVDRYTGEVRTKSKSKNSDTQYKKKLAKKGIIVGKNF